jgi:hypothetical protein
MAKQLKLNLKAVQNIEGNIVDTTITIEPENAFYVFGNKGENLPAYAVHGFDNIDKLFADAIKKAKQKQH